MLKIVSAPSNVLSEKTKPVNKIDKDVLRLIEEMKVTLDATRDPEGVGLAAPQVGQSLQLFIVKPTKKSKHQVFINPVLLAQKNPEQSARLSSPKVEDNGGQAEKRETEIQRSSAELGDKEDTKLEGCLSLPNIWGGVKRADKVYLSYLDEKGREHKRWFDGFTATIIQHEYDHLQGELFPKRVLEQQGQLYKSKRNTKGEDVFEEIEL